MDKRDWFYVNTFVALYLGVVIFAGLTGPSSTGIPPWRQGVYGAVTGTLLIAILIAIRDRLRGNSSTS